MLLPIKIFILSFLGIQIQVQKKLNVGHNGGTSLTVLQVNLLLRKLLLKSLQKNQVPTRNVIPCTPQSYNKIPFKIFEPLSFRNYLQATLL